MLKKLFNWLFAKEDEQTAQPIVHDFSKRRFGHDLTFRVFSGGQDAQGVAISETPVVTGDLLITPKVGYTEEDDIVVFIVLKSEEVAPQVYSVDLTVYEAEDA